MIQWENFNSYTELAYRLSECPDLVSNERLDPERLSVRARTHLMSCMHSCRAQKCVTIVVRLRAVTALAMLLDYIQMWVLKLGCLDLSSSRCNHYIGTATLRVILGTEDVEEFYVCTIRLRIFN